MKIRNGFVSNSSSSSFIIVLPDNFKLKDASPNAQKMLEVLKKDGDVNLMYCKIEGLGYDDLYDSWDELKKSLDKYVIAELDGGADDGNSMILLPNKKLRKILNENT